MIYTSTELLASIKTRAMIPSSQNTFQDSDLLNLANEEMESFIVGTLMRVQEEYLVYTQQIPLVQGQTRYRIPERAIGMKIRDIVMVTNSSKYYLPRIAREAIPEFDSQNLGAGFYLENNNIVLLWEPNASEGYLEVSTFGRPGKIVESILYQEITSVDTSTNTLGMTTLLPAFIVGAKVDVQTHLSGSEYLLRSATITAIDLVNKTVTVDLDTSKVQVGDYLCEEFECAVPQCPEEMHPLLAQRVVCRVLEALNDKDGLANASQKLKEMEVNILALTDSRVEGKPQKVNNRRGLLTSAMVPYIKLGR